MSSINSDITKFRRTVWAYYKTYGRHDLPWRKTTDPYKILVSEFMLQQTQVPRVIEKYKSFLKKFPTVRALAKAPLADVLKEWSGLGYNCRAKYLHESAKHLMLRVRYSVPVAYEELRDLPGVGDYTARAVRVFAFNEREILIETNVRSAITHHFFARRKEIHDDEIRNIAKRAAKGQEPRTWQSALFDYGSFLKRSGVRNNSRSKHYTKQSKFEGSLRQVRGAILRALHDGPQTDTVIYSLIRANRRIAGINLKKALGALERDGLITPEKAKWRIS